MKPDKNQMCLPALPLCASWSGGKCLILSDTHFNRPGCPFFKTHIEAERDRKKAEKRLARMGFKRG